MRVGRTDAYEVWNPEVLDWPDFIDLFVRAFADPKFGVDAEEMRRFVKDHLRDEVEWLRLWVARGTEHGFCGMLISSYGPWPLGPHPMIAHFYNETPESRRALLDVYREWMDSKGLKRVGIINGTGRSDEAHMRLFRSYATGESKGSYIVYEVAE